MPQWTIRRGKYYASCHHCRREVEGSEEKGYGQQQIVVKFRCPCGSNWFKKKPTIDHAVRQGYTNGRGEWIECDEGGFIKPEVIAKIRDQSLGYGHVQVAKAFLEEGLSLVGREMEIAMGALKAGKTDEEARLVVAHYLKTQPGNKRRV